MIKVERDIATPEQGQKLVNGVVEGIGEDATLAQLEGKQVIHQQSITAHSYEEFTHRALEWLDSRLLQGIPLTQNFDLVGHRVVHGGDRFTTPTSIDDDSNNQ